MRDGQAEARRWLRQAENDLAFGELALREGFHSQACFVAQQTAEKALKSIAYAQGERLVLGHSIVELAKPLAAPVPELGKLREQAGLLDQYYVATRYPNGLPRGGGGGGGLRVFWRGARRGGGEGGGVLSRPLASARPGRRSRGPGPSWRWRGGASGRRTRRTGRDRICHARVMR